jgi:hypothetical protein
VWRLHPDRLTDQRLQPHRRTSERIPFGHVLERSVRFRET